jgi:hypothetical protein
MPFGIAMYLRDTSLKFQQQSHDLTRATLNHISKGTSGFTGAYNSNNVPNPYSIETGNGMEDIKWLL